MSDTEDNIIKMKKLLKYMKGYRKECVIGPLLKLAEASLELLVPYIILNIIEIGIENADNGYIIRNMLLLVAMGFVGLLFSVTAQYFCAKAAVGFVSKIKAALFSHIIGLGYPEIDKIGRSTFITRLTSDANQVQTGVNHVLRLFLRSPFIVFGAMICAFTIDVKSALVFAVSIPVLAVCVFAILIVTIPLYKKVQQKLDTILRKTRENLSGVRMLRALCKEESEKKDFHEKNEELKRSQLFVGKISQLMNPLTFVTVNIAVVLLVYAGALRVEDGVLSQAAIIALYSYMSQILVELIKLANLIITITKSLASANRIEAVFETEPKIKQAESGIATLQSGISVEFENVTFGYYSDSDPVIEGLTFSADRGQTVGIIGGTGSGKSTLINLICRFYDADSGRIFIDGKDIKNYGRDELISKIGIVPQASSLFSGDIKSNIRFGKENATEEEIWEALRLAQAESFVKEKEGQLDSPVEQGGRNLSGGQRQRLTIARALVRRPQILIFDDSSSALDYATELSLRRALKSLDYSPVIFIVSQRAASIRHADRIIVLDEGRAVGIGTHDELYGSCLVYKEIVDSQTQSREGA